jgi:hypothetical protein
MQDSSTARSKILSTTSYELKLLLRGILLPACLILFFTYVIISLIDVERNGFFNSIPSSVTLLIGTIVLLKLLFHTKLEKIEIHRFRFIFVTLICWLIGELIYVYYQFFLGIAVPYPSAADIFYLSATVFLSFHLFSILRLKRNITKTKSFVYLGFVASIFPIYLLIDTIYNYEQYYPDSLIEFVVDMAYYISDAVVIFPCIPIILYSPKNDPFIFHWLLIALSVFILVAADLGYTFNASINDELLKNIEWLWSFIFSIGYILLSVSIMWFSKIKQILEYKQFSESLKDEHESGLGRNNSANDFVEEFDNSDQILRAMRSITKKAEKHIDILVAEYVIQRDELAKFVNILVECTRRNRSLNIRLLLPSPKLDEEDIRSNITSNISIEYFDRPLGSNEISSMLDGQHLYIVGFESGNASDQNRYFVQHVNNESKIEVYTVLFERMWLLEKSVDFEQISNKMFSRNN